MNTRSYSFASFGNIASYRFPYSHPRLRGARIPAKRIGIFLDCIRSIIARIFLSMSSVDFHWKASLAPMQRITRLGVAPSSTQSIRERSPAVVSHDIQAFMVL